MLGELGHSVADLKRVQFGPVKITGMRPGDLQALNEEELKGMLNLLAEVKEIQHSTGGNLRPSGQANAQPTGKPSVKQ